MVLGEIERIEIGIEMTANSVHVDERTNLKVLLEHQLFVIVGVDVASPVDRLVGQAEGFEDLFVKLVLAHEQFLNALQEQARLGTLNDAVVVGRGHCHDLGHAQRCDSRRIGTTECDRVVKRTDTNDDALSRHEARNRLKRSDCAGVSEGDRCAGEVVGGQLV